MPETKAHFIDTNIWLYSLLDTGEAEKTEAAQALIKSSEAIVSPQVISEVCANLVKKAKMPEEEIRKFIEGIYAKHRVTEYDMRVFLAASELREEYSLSFWDSLIVSAAFLSGAEVIYSEDMQDGLLVRETVQIINPLK
ncbi:MAG: PIN domain-containing protein [Chloroflexota bacterium]